MARVSGGWTPLVRPALRGAATLMDLFLPPACVVCDVAVDGGGPPVCDLCDSRLREVNPPRCRRCGATRYGDFASPGRCPECERWPVVLRRADAPFRHVPPALTLVHALKYRGLTTLGPYMGRRMASAARRITDSRSVVLVPVPLAPARRRERGYNQAELLARGLADATGWKVADGLRRRWAGPSLVSLGRTARAQHVRDLYTVDPRPLTGMRHASGSVRTLLVDDVVTTGATAAACARALEKAGLECLGVVSFARSLRRAEAE